MKILSFSRKITKKKQNGKKRHIHVKKYVYSYTWMHKHLVYRFLNSHYFYLLQYIIYSKS